jgi:branched-chain amino acid transport system substrate-binding protein
MTSLRAAASTSGGCIKLPGPLSRGLIVSQVLPRERSWATSMVKQARNLAQAPGVKALSLAMLDGLAAARILPEGLRRAGTHRTRTSLGAALEGLGKVDLGGLDWG